MRGIVLVMLAATLGVAVPLAGTHAQTTATTIANKAAAEAQSAWTGINGTWTRTKGEMKVQWGRLTDDDLLEIEGNREILIGRTEIRYGVNREEAERKVRDFEGK